MCDAILQEDMIHHTYWKFYQFYNRRPSYKSITKYFKRLSTSHKKGPKVPNRLTDVTSGFLIVSNKKYELCFFTGLLNTEYPVCKNYSRGTMKNIMTEGDQHLD